MNKQYVSPDGVLRLIVLVEGADWIIGFDGYPWHTHGDILTGSAGESAEARTEKFVDALLSNRKLIAVLKDGDCVTDVWVTEDPAQDARNLTETERVEFRYWDGTQVQPVVREV